jgi:hypothetical protein
VLHSFRHVRSSQSDALLTRRHARPTLSYGGYLVETAATHPETVICGIRAGLKLRERNKRSLLNESWSFRLVASIFFIDLVPSTPPDHGGFFHPRPRRTGGTSQGDTITAWLRDVQSKKSPVR